MTLVHVLAPELPQLSNILIHSFTIKSTCCCNGTFQKSRKQRNRCVEIVNCEVGCCQILMLSCLVNQSQSDIQYLWNVVLSTIDSILRLSKKWLCPVNIWKENLIQTLEQQSIFCRLSWIIGPESYRTTIDKEIFIRCKPLKSKI